MRRLTLLAALSLLPMYGHAADADTQALIEELRQLSDQARQQRAADRWLQRALDDLVARYDWPWRNELVFDDFSDGDFDANPAWEPLAGRFWVARGRGLRSRVDASDTPDSGSAGAQPQPSVEAAIVGALLQQALGTREGGGSTATGPAASGEPNRIRLRTHISNAFAIDSEFSLEAPDAPGRFALAVLQGSTGQYGYRLRLQSGSDGFAELERVRGGRGAVVDHTRLTSDPGDGGRHQLAWRQAPDGQVMVELDGQTLFSVRDKAFRDDYQELILSHQAGDLTLHSVRVSGTD